MGIEACEKGGAGRAATGSIVELSIANTVLCQSVNIGGLYLAAIAAYVAVTHIIGKDEDNVGAFFCLCCCCQCSYGGCEE